jgi:L-alanine-DL-glutamate epimerase-like enolase superfamily enzyme
MEVIMRRREFLGLSALFLSNPFPKMESLKTVSQSSSPTYLKAKIYEVKLKHAWGLSRGTWTVRRNVLVKIERDGVTGFGEGAPIPRYNESAESALSFIEKAKPILEKDLWEYYERWKEIDSLSPGEHAGKAALDMAILDWVCKKLNVPLYRFLGLNKEKTPITTFSIGIDEVEVMKEKVKEAKDFPIYKIKVGTKDDKKIIEGIREVTDKPLRVDANEGWKSKEEALEMINWMAEKGVEFIEQPLPASMLEEQAWLKERSKIPIFADESLMTSSDIPKIANAFHGINIKLMKCGGIQEAIRMVAMARAFGLKVMLGCMIETSCGITAGASISPLFDYVDLDGNLLIINDPFKGVETSRGRLILSEKPGLGLEVLEKIWD